MLLTSDQFWLFIKKLFNYVLFKSMVDRPTPGTGVGHHKKSKPQVVNITPGLLPDPRNITLISVMDGNITN